MESLEQLQKFFEEHEIENVTYFTEPSYVTAIIGMTHDGNHIVYDYRKMVDYLVETDGMEVTEAYEFIDYNTIRSIPYMGEFAPVVVNSDIIKEV